MPLPPGYDRTCKRALPGCFVVSRGDSSAAAFGDFRDLDHLVPARVRFDVPSRFPAGSHPPDLTLRHPPMSRLGVQPARANLRLWKWCACLALASCTFSAHTVAEHGFNKGDWPFRPLERSAVPTATGNGWAVNTIDQFIASALEKRGLVPNVQADKLTLLRRVTFDLTGLPPTPDEVAAFLADDSPLAYEQVVDRLLASPHFGERWARHWLDVVRFSDTAGFRPDILRPDAYRYRDYVIRAFNTDLPYDRFVGQQIAGDELEPGNPDALIATGFLRLFAAEGNAANFAKQRQDVLDDVTEVTGLTFLGLTLGCAKCHDHKFDPIEQTDFFQLQACFSAIELRDDLAPVTADVLATHNQQLAKWEAATASIRAEIDAVTEPVRTKAMRELTVAYDEITQKAWFTPMAQRTTEQRQLIALSSHYINNITDKRISRLEGEAKAKYDALHAELAKFDSLKPAPLPAALAVSNGPGPAPETHVLDSGDYRKPEEIVAPGFPDFLGKDDLESSLERQERNPVGRRSALAKWLTWSDHPLTARVIVNRLWQHHFGAGIVATSNDFGLMGDTPANAPLLDWLACELVNHGWSLKAIHRQMVLSATYQQSSHIDPASQQHKKALQADPTNKLLWHARRQRLDGEVVRDALYAVSGRIDTRMFGPSTYLRLPQAVINTSRYAWSPDDVEANWHRRSIYSFQMRNMRHPLLASFDQPDMYASCGVRMETLTPTQSLALFNGEETAEQATFWAGRLLAESPNDDSLVRRAFLEIYGRPATSDEITGTKQFLATQAEQIYSAESDVPTSSQPQPCPTCLEPHKAAAYVDFCHALLNSTEFLFVD